MVDGLNTDIEILGVVYHVQSEDWGETTPHIVSRVFRNGLVLKSIKTPYGKFNLPPETVKRVLQSQHAQILDQLASGQLSLESIE